MRQKWRLVPKAVREGLRLGAGDSLSLEAAGDGVMLWPVRAASPVRQENGLWVFHSGSPVSATEVEQVLEGVRQERDGELAGKLR